MLDCSCCWIEVDVLDSNACDALVCLPKFKKYVKGNPTGQLSLKDFKIDTPGFYKLWIRYLDCSENVIFEKKTETFEIIYDQCKANPYCPPRAFPLKTVNLSKKMEHCLNLKNKKRCLSNMVKMPMPASSNNSNGTRVIGTSQYSIGALNKF